MMMELPGAEELGMGVGEAAGQLGIRMEQVLKLVQRGELLGVRYRGPLGWQLTRSSVSSYAKRAVDGSHAKVQGR